MFYKILADIVVIVHLSFIVFVVIGGLLVIIWKKMLWLHLLTAIWGAIIEFGNYVCPLTPLENWLRLNSNTSGYEESFIEHYIMPIIYPIGLTRDIQIILGILVIIANILVYSIVIRYYIRKKKKIKSKNINQ